MGCTCSVKDPHSNQSFAPMRVSNENLETERKFGNGMTKNLDEFVNIGKDDTPERKFKRNDPIKFTSLHYDQNPFTSMNHLPKFNLTDRDNIEERKIHTENLIPSMKSQTSYETLKHMMKMESHKDVAKRPLSQSLLVEKRPKSHDSKGRT